MSADPNGPNDPNDLRAVVDEVSSWLTLPADEVDRHLGAPEYGRVTRSVSALNHRASSGDAGAFHLQQLLLGRIYGVLTRIPDGPSAEGSVLLHTVTRLLERATMAAEDTWIEPGLLDQAPTEGRAFVSWLKRLARQHQSYHHPYYAEFHPQPRHGRGLADLRHPGVGGRRPL